MTTAPVLAIRDLSVSYASAGGRVGALRNVALEVPPNRVIGLVGESGCGKSTVLTAILGLLDPRAEIAPDSSIRFAGEELVGASQQRLRALRGDRISMIFQDPMTTLNPVISIGQQMVDIQFRTPELGRQAKRARAAEMLAKVGISDPVDRLNGYPHQMSGGIRQRISIAMALMSEPDLLIADEPTTALDATLEVQILDLLKTLQATIGCAILYVSHQLGTVAQLCHSVTVMYAGTVVEHGEVGEIFNAPRHPYTRALLDCDPGRIERGAERLPSIPGRVPDLVDVPIGCIFRDRCPDRFSDCQREAPALLVSGRHSVACHLHDRARSDG